MSAIAVHMGEVERITCATFQDRHGFEYVVFSDTKQVFQPPIRCRGGIEALIPDFLIETEPQ